MRNNKICLAALLVCILLALLGCGKKRESTVLVDSSSYEISPETSPHPSGGPRQVIGEEVFPFTSEEADFYGGNAHPEDGSGGEGSPDGGISGTEGTGSGGESTVSSGESTDSRSEGKRKKPFFLDELFHREPTTLDDNEMEILRQARTVYVIMEEDTEIAKEKANSIQEGLQSFGCEVVVCFCERSKEKAEAAFMKAIGDGAGTVIFELPLTELSEECLESIRNASIRCICLGDMGPEGITPVATILPDESSGVRELAWLAAYTEEDGSYLYVGADSDLDDLAAQFDEVLDYTQMAKLTRADSMYYLTPDEAESYSKLADILYLYPDLRLVLCGPTIAASDASAVLAKLGRNDIKVYCMIGENNILELLTKGSVDAASVLEINSLTTAVMRAVDSLAEKGNAGDYALVYIPTIVREKTLEED